MDEQQDVENTIPSVWEVTNPELALVRLHGRNHATWNKKGLKTSSQRFDYDYRNDELKEIADEVRILAPKARTTHVLFYNKYRTKAKEAQRRSPSYCRSGTA